jgi:hypothetical protein
MILKIENDVADSTRERERPDMHMESDLISWIWIDGCLLVVRLLTYLQLLLKLKR